MPAYDLSCRERELLGKLEFQSEIAKRWWLMDCNYKTLTLLSFAVDCFTRSTSSTSNSAKASFRFPRKTWLICWRTITMPRLWRRFTKRRLWRSKSFVVASSTQKVPCEFNTSRETNTKAPPDLLASWMTSRFAQSVVWLKVIDFYCFRYHFRAAFLAPPTKASCHRSSTISECI